MAVVISVLAAQGVLRIVEAFTELTIAASCVIASLACSLSVIALTWWKEN
jgi:hypothetical protein